MRSTSRGRTLAFAFLGALTLGGASTMAAGPAPAATTGAVPAAGHDKPVAARKPGHATGATPASAGKVAADRPAPRAEVPRPAAGAPPPSSGPKVEARRGRGHF
jgi:hypothetical protein